MFFPCFTSILFECDISTLSIHIALCLSQIELPLSPLSCPRGAEPQLLGYGVIHCDQYYQTISEFRVSREGHQGRTSLNLKQ